jgi:GT2 family glycosyltransferase
VRPILAPAVRPPIEPLSTPPTFSILVAVYQAADVVAEAVGSALGQTVPPLEVVVCDDGSTDDVAGALSPFRDQVTLISKENGGEASAKNAAARAAAGEFLAILDADDVYLAERLEALGELARARPDLDVLTTDAVLEVDGEPVRRCYTDELPFEVEDQRSAILRRNFVFGLAAVRRERFLAAGGFDEALRYATDWDLWARLILDGSRVGLVAESLARYRLRSGSLSSQRPALLAGRVAVLEKAAESSSLTASERKVVAASLRLERRRLAVARARAALLGELPAPRRRSLAVALGRGHGLRTRAKAAAASIAPRRAGSSLGSRARETTGGIALEQGDAEPDR